MKNTNGHFNFWPNQQGSVHKLSQRPKGGWRSANAYKPWQKGEASGQKWSKAEGVALVLKGR